MMNNKQSESIYYYTLSKQSNMASVSEQLTYSAAILFVRLYCLSADDDRLYDVITKR